MGLVANPSMALDASDDAPDKVVKDDKKTFKKQKAKKVTRDLNATVKIDQDDGPSKCGIKSIAHSMGAFWQQTGEKYCELTGLPLAKLKSKPVKFPGIDDGQLEQKNWEQKGKTGHYCGQDPYEGSLRCSVCTLGLAASNMQPRPRNHQMESQLRYPNAQTLMLHRSDERLHPGEFLLRSGAQTTPYGVL